MIKNLSDKELLKLEGGCNNATVFTFRLFQIEAFGSVKGYLKCKYEFYNNIRDERLKRECRDEFGLTRFEIDCQTLELFIDLFFDSRDEYNRLRDKAAKRAYHERSKKNGELKKQKERARAKRKTKAYRDKRNEYIKKNYERVSEQKRQWHYKKHYGDMAEPARLLNDLKKEIRKKEKGD